MLMMLKLTLHKFLNISDNNVEMLILSLQTLSDKHFKYWREEIS